MKKTFVVFFLALVLLFAIASTAYAATTPAYGVRGAAQRVVKIAKTKLKNGHGVVTYSTYKIYYHVTKSQNSTGWHKANYYAWFYASTLYNGKWKCDANYSGLSTSGSFSDWYGDWRSYSKLSPLYQINYQNWNYKVIICGYYDWNGAE
jgi:hypothetical protein